MGRGPSWRLKFIDIDTSFTITTDTGDICGYMVIRAPAGNTEPMYFPAGNAQAIEAVYGVATADWPDIEQATAFNAEYGLFISAPPGTSDEYPSYFGGKYITSKGNFDFYRVTEKETPNYWAAIPVGKEDTYDAALTPSTMSVTLPEVTNNDGVVTVSKQGSVTFTGIPADVFSKLTNLDFNYWGNGTVCPAGLYTYKVGPMSKGVAEIYCLDEDGVEVTKEGAKILCGFVEKVKDPDTKVITYNLTFGGSKATNSDSDPVPFLDFTAMNLDCLKAIIANYNPDDYSLVTKEEVELETYRLEEVYYIKNDDNSYTPIVIESKEELLARLSRSETATDEYRILPVKLYTATTENDETQYIEATEFKPDTIYFKKVDDTYEHVSILSADDFNRYVNGTFEMLTHEPEEIYTYTGSYSRPESFIDIILDGNDGSFEYTLDNETDTLGKSVIGLRSRFTELLYIKDICHLRIVQKSPTEKVTKVTINAAGYDQYKYDHQMPWVWKRETEFNLGKFVKVNARTDFDFDLTPGTVYAEVDVDNNNNTSVVLYETPAEGSDRTNVTAQYLTQAIRLVGKSLDKKPFQPNKNSEYFTDEAFTDAIFYVESKTKVIEQTADGEYPFALVSDLNYNTFTISCTQEVYPGKQTTGLTQVQGSLSETGVDSYGSEIYFPTIVPEDSLSFVDIYPDKLFDEFCNRRGCYTGNRIENGTLITLKGQRNLTNVVRENIAAGVNGCSTNDSAFLPAMKEGWNYMISDPETYDPTNVAMDPTGYEDLKPLLLSARQTFKMTTFISPKSITQAEYENPNLITVAGRGRGTAQYVGEFLVKDPYTNKKYWMKPIGYVGLKLARIIDLRLGGAAPMWNDDSNGLGGQLACSVLKARWPFKDSATEIMDKKGINPIIYNNSDGVMIVSQRSTQDPTNTTDWSYLGHSMAFDLCKREIRDNVMRPQIGKLNNDYYQEMRQTATEAILDRRTSGSNPIWAAAECHIKDVNTTTVKAQRKFAIKVRVQVNVFSEIVELSFENTAQGTLVND